MPTAQALNLIRRALMVLALLGVAMAPVASFSHGLLHQFEDRGDAQKHSGGAKTACPVCVQFAGVGQPAASFLALDLPSAAIAAAFPAAPQSTLAARITAYRQRAPPNASAK